MFAITGFRLKRSYWVKRLVSAAMVFSAFVFSSYSVATANEGDAYVLDEGITIDVSDRKLYYVVDSQVVAVFDVGVPKSEKLTVYGETQVYSKRKDFWWHPTPNMVKKDPSLKPVPPGPSNPMGRFLLDIDDGQKFRFIRIHGTNNENSIGYEVSAGCFRMYNDDIEWLYQQVEPGVSVAVVP